jgi:hypothetical protein
VIAHQYSFKTIILLMLMLVQLASVGCQPVSFGKRSLWKSQKAITREPVVLHDDGSVVVEVAIGNIPPSVLPMWERAWRQLDTQALDLDTRRLLDENGIRVGIAGTRIPRELETVVNWSEPISPDGNTSGSDHRSLVSFEKNLQFGMHKYRQLRPGSVEWFACSPVADQVAWQTVRAGEIKSGVCASAEAGAGISLVTASRGLVELRVVPEIHHGELKHRYALGETDFIYDTSRDQLVLPELGFTCRLAAGETLVVAATDPETGIGKLMFGSAAHGGQPAQSGLPPRFLLVRAVSLPDANLFPSGNSTSRGLSTRLD